MRQIYDSLHNRPRTLCSKIPKRWVGGTRRGGWPGPGLFFDQEQHALRAQPPESGTAHQYPLLALLAYTPISPPYRRRSTPVGGGDGSPALFESASFVVARAVRYPLSSPHMATRTPASTVATATYLSLREASAFRSSMLSIPKYAEDFSSSALLVRYSRWMDAKSSF